MTTKKPTRPSVKLVAGHASTTSTAVAQFFGKRHDNVLQAIDTLIKNASPDKSAWCLLNFQEVIREVDSGKGAKASYREYEITRDGFAVLGMGFTGKEAFAWKIKYIEAFNKLEERATQRAVVVATRKIAADQAAARRKALPAPGMGYHYPRNMLDQPYFTLPSSGKATIRMAMLSDTEQFVSPLMALLNQLRSEGHDVTAPFDEAVAMRSILANADKCIEEIRYLTTKMQYKLG